MQRKLGDWNVCPIGLGCMSLSWAYGHNPSDSEAERLLHAALDQGYNHLDTANIYGNGKSEERIGKAISGRRNEFFLASKTGLVAGGDKRGIDCHPDSIAASIDASLARLQTDHIDLLYMHRFDPTVPIADSVGALARAQEAGKIGGYGVSEWSSDQIREANAVHPMMAVQTEYSLWTRNVELAVLETTRELGIAFVAFSPVGRGALCGLINSPDELNDKDFRGAMPRFYDENWPVNRKLIDGLMAIAAREGVTAAQLSLAWVLAQGDHIHAIPGTSNLEHLSDNIATLDKVISDDALAEAGALINQQTVAGDRYNEIMGASVQTENFAA